MNFNNATFILRNEISNLFKKELSTSDDYDLICDKVLPMFEVLKENEKLYQSIISIIFLDEICYTDIILDLINNYKENILTNESICDTELEELLNPHNDIIAICNISYQNENIRHKLLRMYLNIKRPNSANKDYSKIKKNK